ncbi:hypothetical protein GGR58DRAFT_101171 [Xylaria digitata]|nr:hypothetical protein GGR58DRAFT_101171 [Xylaria digitata]
MCIYRKSLFLCNHSQLSVEPQVPCPAHKDYLSGNARESCNKIQTHSLSTIRVSRLCEGCRTKKTTLDRRLSNVKEKIAELRKHLDNTYGDCMKHVRDAGLELETKPEDEGNLKNEGDTKSEKVDPVQAFLEMKMKEKHSHLMMLGGSKGK